MILFHHRAEKKSENRTTQKRPTRGLGRNPKAEIRAGGASPNSEHDSNLDDQGGIKACAELVRIPALIRQNAG